MYLGRWLQNSPSAIFIGRIWNMLLLSPSWGKIRNANCREEKPRNPWTPRFQAPPSLQHSRFYHAILWPQSHSRNVVTIFWNHTNAIYCTAHFTRYEAMCANSSRYEWALLVREVFLFLFYAGTVRSHHHWGNTYDYIPFYLSPLWFSVVGRSSFLSCRKNGSQTLVAYSSLSTWLSVFFFISSLSFSTSAKQSSVHWLLDFSSLLDLFFHCHTKVAQSVADLHKFRRRTSSY